MVSRRSGAKKPFPAWWKARGRDKLPPPTIVDNMLKHAEESVPFRILVLLLFSLLSWDSLFVLVSASILVLVLVLVLVGPSIPF